MITVESVVSTICLDLINVLLIFKFYLMHRMDKKDCKKFIIILLLYILFDMLISRKSKILLDIIIISLVGSVYGKIFQNIFLIILFYISEFLTYILFLLLFKVDILIRDFLVNNVLTVFQTIISKYLIYVVIHYILYRKNRLTDFKVKIFKYISLGVSVFYGITILVFYHEILFYHVSVGRIFVFTLLLYNVVLVIFNYYQKMHIRTVSELDLLKQSIDYQKEYLHKVIETEETLRKIKHDTVHAYAGMHGMAKEGKYEELISYLETFIKETKEIEKVSYFGDSFIDSIICHKISDAREKGIEIEIECGMISIGKIASTDLGILTANALSNAIEAAEKVEGEKKVRMSISTVGSYLRMTVRNSVEEGKEISFTKTSKKEDRENHGIGIRSMRHIVERYSGSMRYEREGDEVELAIIMCII